MKYWLMKSEPTSYSIDDLKRDRKTFWGGVRNYQARNFMMKDMQVGDEVLFYHSNADPSGIAGLAKVVKLAAPDKTALDPKDHHYDPKSTTSNPIWFGVEIAFVNKLPTLISLQELKNNPKLTEMLVLKKGSRLSIQPVENKHFSEVIKMSHVSRRTSHD